LQIVDELDSLGIEFVSRREGVATGSPMSRLFVTISSAIAELERSLKVTHGGAGEIWDAPGPAGGSASWSLTTRC
jgi:hypothetical protein